MLIWRDHAKQLGPDRKGDQAEFSNRACRQAI